MKATEFTVELVRQVDESYPIVVGRGLETQLVEVAGRGGLADRRVALITDSTVVGLVADRVVAEFAAAGRDVDVSELPTMPSGRVQRDAADELFAAVKAEYEADPESWLSAYRLARAYDYAGDRSRARDWMTRAVKMEKAAR